MWREGRGLLLCVAWPPADMQSADKTEALSCLETTRQGYSSVQLKLQQVLARCTEVEHMHTQETARHEETEASLGEQMQELENQLYAAASRADAVILAADAEAASLKSTTDSLRAELARAQASAARKDMLIDSKDKKILEIIQQLRDSKQDTKDALKRAKRLDKVRRTTAAVLLASSSGLVSRLKVIYSTSSILESA